MAAAAGGAKLGSDHQIAKRAKTEKLIAQVREQAQLGAADAINGIEVKHTTINRRVEREIRENTVYRDCVNTPVAIELLDNARANRAIGPIEAIVPPATGRSESQ